MEQNKKTDSCSCCGNTLKEQIKAKWNKLTENEINEAEKNMEALSGKIQKAYGRSKEFVDREVSEFRQLLSSKSSKTKLL